MIPVLISMLPWLANHLRTFCGIHSVWTATCGVALEEHATENTKSVFSLPTAQPCGRVVNTDPEITLTEIKGCCSRLMPLLQKHTLIAHLCTTLSLPSSCNPQLWPFWWQCQGHSLQALPPPEHPIFVQAENMVIGSCQNREQASCWARLKGEMLRSWQALGGT